MSSSVGYENISTIRYWKNYSKVIIRATRCPNSSKSTVRNYPNGHTDSQSNSSTAISRTTHIKQDTSNLCQQQQQQTAEAETPQQLCAAHRSPFFAQPHTAFYSTINRQHHIQLYFDDKSQPRDINDDVLREQQSSLIERARRKYLQHIHTHTHVLHEIDTYNNIHTHTLKQARRRRRTTAGQQCDYYCIHRLILAGIVVVWL